MARRPDNIVVGLDLGTTKVCAIVGEVKDGGQVDIIGIGLSPSHGLKKGVVVNIDSTVESIKKAVKEAEMMAGVEINAVYSPQDSLRSVKMRFEMTDGQERYGIMVHRRLNGKSLPTISDRIPTIERLKYLPMMERCCPIMD